jgi:hypothetical protein
LENFAYLGEDNAVVWLDALGMDTNHLKLVSNTILAIMRVRQVLEEQVRLNALRLIDRTLEETPLLALAVGQNYLPCLAGTRSDQDSIEKSDSSGAESLILTKLDEILKAFETGGGIRPQGRKARAKPGFQPNATRFSSLLSPAI